mmetsp:Transcript_11493/g.20775  ORF Transcript_11493/g.20775 Transcript_11493/m.20775 type:complete len:165 (+) Transcript_11493:179-673(+)
MAEQNPDSDYIGIEIHRGSMVKMLRKLDTQQFQSLNNIKILKMDAMIALNRVIPRNSIRSIHVYFPDPFPDQIDRNRRLFRPQFITTLRNCLELDHGSCYIATDDQTYANHIQSVFTQYPGNHFTLTKLNHRPTWRPISRYEHRALTQPNPVSVSEFILKRSTL